METIEEELSPNLKLLAIGFLPPPLGGVSVSFEIFCNTLARDNKVDLTVINLSNIQKDTCLPKALFILIKQMWLHIGKCDVVKLYCATPQLSTIGLVILIVCRFRRKLFILRKAAGTDHRTLGGVAGRIADFVVKCSDLFLAQTKVLVALCRKRGVAHAKWYPTNRPLGPPAELRNKCKRLVFMGQIRLSKGIFELIEAAEGLPNSGIVDVYGPFFDDLDETIFKGKTQINYRGILRPDKVAAKLREYDAFVLPTKAVTEGYPGFILEALSVGLPGISTTVGGIPEIINDHCGILVSPGNVAELRSAMHRLILDESLYASLCKGALSTREEFSSEYWTNWLVAQCKHMLSTLER
ncbi:MAG: putative teichuronic acid biosynthesis glycosyltransferase TuaC [Smithella sp. PtaU1.Bin162]|nr:MAG: putative teichuronic acid biosynthesis glycosyltransferase TuaC [Smithella sp. PtaU1.Bin162]